jgi:hypothetical protein
MTGFILLSASPAGAQDIQLELAVKATYLAKLSPFVEWPGATVQFPDGVFPICIVGPDPFGSLVDRAAGGQTVAGRPVVVRRLDSIAGDSPCALAFIAINNPAVIEAIQGRPILTVTDQASDVRMKGIINFIVRDNRVRLEIDDIAAARSGLGISSKLLSLAASLRSRSEPR